MTTHRSHRDVVEDDARRDAAAGMLAGVLAGIVYLVAQMTFAATVLGGAGWEPLQRIAALLLGPDAAPPPAAISPTIVGMALILHLPLSALFGRFVAFCVGPVDGRWTALAGLACGLSLYIVNFWLLAPVFFPWFLDSRHAVTAFDHALFGIVAAIAFLVIRRSRLLRARSAARS